MKFSTDGGKTWREAKQGIRIEYPNCERIGGADMQFNFTLEGLIVDVTNEDEIIHTAFLMLEDVYTLCR